MPPEPLADVLLLAVQDIPGRADPGTTTRYARVVDKALNNPAAAIPDPA
jgi:hypothetical protein